MVLISLAAAEAAERRGDWHVILGVERGASSDEVVKARRALQRVTHPDKGGTQALSKLVNQAADKLLDLTRQREQRGRAAAKQAARAAAERAAEREAVERAMAWAAARAAEQAAEREAVERAMAARAKAERLRAAWTVAERVAAEREHAAAALAAHAARVAVQREYVRLTATRRSSKRGTNARTKVYLSSSTRALFPHLGRRISVLQGEGRWEKSRCLAYAAEAELGARRAVRETKFPKTAGLAARDPVKAQLMAALKVRYNVAYQRVRYLRTGRGSRGASFSGMTLHRLRLTSILHEAWTVLMSQPPPILGGVAIPMEGN